MARRMTLTTEPPSDTTDTFTITVLGNSGVGKCTMLSWVIKHWDEMTLKKTKRTRSFDDYGVSSKSLIVNIFDTNSIKWMSSYGLPESDVFVLVYSLVDERSFQAVCQAREKIVQLKGVSTPIVIVGNKKDIVHYGQHRDRVIRDEMILSDWQHSHVEISAEVDTNARQILEQILRQYHRHSRQIYVRQSIQKKKGLRKLFGKRSK